MVSPKKRKPIPDKQRQRCQKLERFARQLRELIRTERGRCREAASYGTVALPVLDLDAARYVAAGLKRYAASERKSLDHAFGLVGRGRPKGSGGSVVLAIKIAERRLAGWSWASFAKELDRDSEERSNLKEIVERYSHEISAHFARLIVDRVNRRRDG